MKDVISKIKATALYGASVESSPDDSIDNLCAFLNRLNKKGYLSDKEMLCCLYNRSECGAKKLALNEIGDFYVV